MAIVFVFTFSTLLFLLHQRIFGRARTLKNHAVHLPDFIEVNMSRVLNSLTDMVLVPNTTSITSYERPVVMAPGF